jgi:phage tail protein X
MAQDVILIAHDGEAIDALIWRAAGLGPDALIGVLDANIHLSERPTLNAGDRVRIPAPLLNTPQPAPQQARVQLWD